MHQFGRPRAAQTLNRRLHIEMLEDRRMLAAVTVDTQLDLVDASDGVTSLREAIVITNQNIAPDVIDFASSLAGQTILLTMGELAVTDDLTISGPGANQLTIDASGNDPTPSDDNGDGSRVFNIDNDNSLSSLEFSISGLTLTGGDVSGDGGAVSSQEGFTNVRAFAILSFVDEARVSTGTVDLALAQQNAFATFSFAATGVAGLNIRVVGTGVAAGSQSAVNGGIDITFVDDAGTAGGVDSAIYDVVSNEIRIDADFRSGTLTENEIATAIQRINGASSTFFATATGTINLAAGDAGRYSNVSFGGQDAETASIAVTGSVAAGANGNLSITIIEANGQGATPSVSGSVATGYVVSVDDSIATTIPAIASAIQSITEIATATTPSTASYLGAADTPPTTDFIAGGLDAGSDVVTIVADADGTAANGVTVTIIEAAGVGGTTPSAAFNGSNIEVTVDDTLTTTIAVIANAISILPGYIASIVDTSGDGNYVGATDTPPPFVTLADGSGLLAGRLFLDGMVISDSHAVGDGGGISSRGAVNVTNSTIAGNRAIGNGGGISSTEYVELRNSTISGNRTTGDNARGGGIAAATNITVQMSTVTDNHALGMNAVGGGTWSSFGSATVTGSIVAGNAAMSGPDLALGIGTVAANDSLLGDVSDLTLAGTNLQIGVDPLLGPLANYGGPTPTHELLSGSPAIDMGNPSLVAGTGTTPDFDQRGAPFGRVQNGRIDIGAFESRAINGDFDSNGVVSGFDFLAWQRGFGTSSGVTKSDGDATGDRAVDGNDLAVWEATFGEVITQVAAQLVVDEQDKTPALTSSVALTVTSTPVEIVGRNIFFQLAGAETWDTRSAGRVSKHQSDTIGPISEQLVTSSETRYVPIAGEEKLILERFFSAIDPGEQTDFVALDEIFSHLEEDHLSAGA